MKSLNNFEQNSLAELNNINVIFDLNRQCNDSAKNLFVRFIQNPFEYIFSTDNEFHCLKNVSLSIKEGDRIALLGKNGSGKTTLCHVLSRSLYPSAGSLKLNCKVRSVYHSTSHLFPELSGRENAKVLARLLYPSVSVADLNEITNEVISFSELGTFANAPIKTYSKGMAARMLLSLVTALPSDLLIMDELFDGADQFFMDKFTPRFEKVIGKSKATLFVNHDTAILKKYCSRVIVLNEGKIEYDGPPAKGFFFYENQLWLQKDPNKN